MNPKKRCGQWRRRAFTLVEVMIVIAIILALSGLVGVALFRQRDKAKVQLCEIDMKNIQGAMKLFKLNFDRWPMEEEGLEVLWNKEVLDPDSKQEDWVGYLDEALPTDRWGTEWGYRPESEYGDETEYDLWSNGPDKEEGTEDDITSWDDSDGEDGFGGGGFNDAP